MDLLRYVRRILSILSVHITTMDFSSPSTVPPKKKTESIYVRVIFRYECTYTKKNIRPLVSNSLPLSLYVPRKKYVFFNTQRHHLDVSENSGFSPQIIHFNKGFPLFSPSILGYCIPIFGIPPISTFAFSDCSKVLD